MSWPFTMVLTNIFYCHQAPPSWVKMQAVVSPGANPLPAEIRCKYGPKRWFGLRQEDWLYQDGTTIRKSYIQGSKQQELRSIIQASVIRTFYTICYEKDDNTQISRPTFGKPLGHMLEDVIDVVQSELNSLTLRTIRSDIEQTITVPVIAQLCLDLTETFVAGKNWNSHGAKFGAAVCNIAAMIQATQVPFDHKHYAGLKGLPLGGQRHGGRDTKYVEYMTTDLEHSTLYGEPRPYLEHVEFYRKQHYKKVEEIFETRIQGLDYPSPIPSEHTHWTLDCHILAAPFWTEM